MVKPIVIVSSPIDPAGFRKLEGTTDVRFVDHSKVADEEFMSQLQQADGVITRSLKVTAALMEACPRLKIVAKHGSGVDTIDVAAATRLGIVVANSGAANALGVAEGAIALVFSTLRRVFDMRPIVVGANFAAERDKLRFSDLSGTTVGLVGFGNIGRVFARICRGGFGTRIMVFDPAVTAGDAAAEGAEKIEKLHDLLPQVDVLSIHAPLLPSTHHIIGAPELALMKPGSILVNTSRGGLVDEHALARALSQRTIAGAGVDVFEDEPPSADNPLFSVDNVVLTPHCAGLSDSAYVNAATASAQAVLDVFSGRSPQYLINPEVLSRSRFKVLEGA